MAFTHSTPAASVHDTLPAPSLRPVADALTQEASRAGAIALHAWQQHTGRLRDTARDLGHTLGREASAAGLRSRRYVQQQPVRTVLIGAVIGAAVSGLLAVLARRGS